MNNEFNNQGMNQFQSNNNFNNGYVNNQNNKNDNWKNVLIGVIAVIILGLVALTIYVVVDKKDNNIQEENKDNVQENENKDNIQEENKDNVQENENKDNIQEENKDNVQENENKDNSNVEDNNKKDYAKLEQRVLDEYYLKTTDVINEHIVSFSYSKIANKEISYEEFRKKYITYNIINSLKPISSIGGCLDINYTVSHIDDEYDKNGVKYPKYCIDKFSCVEDYAKEYGLTVEEINKMDKNIWSNIKPGCYYMYDVTQIKKKYPMIYNEIFNSSFYVEFFDPMIVSPHRYIYDKNLEKILFNNVGGGEGTFYEQVIVESKEENNMYKVRFVEGFLESNYDGTYNLLNESKIVDSISGYNNIKTMLIENKDKLPNYEVIFEKVSTGYKFKEINKVS